MGCIINVPNLSSSFAAERLAHDYNYVEQLFDILAVECKPVTVHELEGRQQLPATNKSCVTCQRVQEHVVHAPKLRFFFQKGIHLRPSLPLEERKRLREALLPTRVSVIGILTPDTRPGWISNRRRPCLVPILVALPRSAVLRWGTAERSRFFLKRLPAY